MAIAQDVVETPTVKDSVSAAMEEVAGDYRYMDGIYDATITLDEKGIFCLNRTTCFGRLIEKKGTWKLIDQQVSLTDEDGQTETTRFIHAEGKTLLMRGPYERVRDFKNMQNQTTH
ncbi:hypothetical protein GCM10011339_08240 [Echinicola rosea]|uniref:Lipocalin-like domain-containing protein n=2 Tax=Echinicola rosea TaxID=1807691 RepID=A0ABQ1UMR7_9BACT|nr:hypothetical protein GCM10011339_08240 [Echinicola rosea]